MLGIVNQHSYLSRESDTLEDRVRNNDTGIDGYLEG